jgi:hypothetical protein
MEDENNNIYDEIQGLNEEEKTMKKNTSKKALTKNSNSKSKDTSKNNIPNQLSQTTEGNHLFVAKPRDLSYFNQFSGFFNTKFNLTSFKKEREESRSASKSPKIRLPHQIRGNGIPKTLTERFKFLKDTFENEKFKKAYEKCPKRNESSLEDFCEYIVNYSKKNTVINAIFLAYYYICHEIKYDSDYKEKFEEFKDFKIAQQAENVYESGLGLSLGFTNLFETIMKKLDVRFRHIEGYCKYLPRDNSDFINNLYSTKKNNNKNNNISLTMYNNSTNTSSILNSSKFMNSNKFFDYYEPETENIYDYINHCWDSIWYKGEWYLVDTLFGSGSVEIEDKIAGPNQITSKDPNENFNLFYILIWPNLLINSHFPAEDNWQLTDKIITFKQFLNKFIVDYPKFYKGVFEYNVDLLTHKEPFIQITNKDNLIIKLKIPNYIIEGNLYSPATGQKVSEIKFNYEQKDKIFTFEPIFPKIGDYILRVSLRAINSTDLSYRPLFDYRIRVINTTLFNYFNKYNTKLISHRYDKERPFDDILPKIGNRNPNLNTNYNINRIVSDYKKIFPSKSIKRVCYDNEGFYLLEPRSGFIRKGVVTKFRVRIKGASNASILDGHKLINLKRKEDDVYEGQKMLETDNVSICCLRGKNVFTEVFKFRPRKNKYELSHSQGVNHSTIFKKA